MGNMKKLINFDNKLLEELKTKEHACVEVHRLSKHLYLHPVFLGNIESIKESLKKNVAKFDKTLGGIFLGFKNAKTTTLAPIYDESFFLHVDIEADFYLFKPEVGKTLNGIIIKKSADNIGVLVHNVFNVSIPKTDGNWKGNSAQIGNDVQMEIVYTNFEGRLPFIKAKLISILSENTSTVTSKKIYFSNEDEPDMDETLAVQQTISNEISNGTPKSTKQDNNTGGEEKRSKKRKRSISENFTEIADTEKPAKKRKKSKRQIVESGETVANQQEMQTSHAEDLNDSLGVAILENSFKKKKKRKHKKQEPINELISNEIMDTSVIQERSSNKKSKKEKSTNDSREEMQQLPFTKAIITNDSRKKKEKKSKKKKSKEAILDNSYMELPDLNLDNLFYQSDLQKISENFQMADMEDKVVKKRHSTALDIQWENKTLDLPADSDLEQIFSKSKKSKKHKRKSE